MTNNWKTYKLGEIANINMGQSPKSSTYSDNKSFIPFLQGNRTFGKMYPSFDVFCKSPLKTANVGDILLSVRAPVGDLNIANCYLCIGRGLCSIKAKKEIDNIFLFYSLKSNIQKIINQENGSVFGSINKAILGNIEFCFPNLNTQHQIASILSSFDNKIELNLQMNQTLETEAKAIFKEWFVKFNFPGFDGLLMDGLPEGWRIGEIGDEFKITMGQSPPGETYNEDGQGTIFFQGRSDFGFRFPEIRMFTTAPNRMAKKLDTLVSVRAPVGDINMAIEDCCLGRGLSAVRHKSDAYSFTYYSMKNIENIFKGFEGEGTVFGSINKSNFENIEVIVPDKKVIKEFEILVNSIDEKILNNSFEIMTLTQIRDNLLPKLMSGKIEVNS